MKPRPIAELFDVLHARGLRWAGACGLASLLLGFFDGTALLQGWLVAFLFWSSFSLGALALVMLQHLTGGAWGMAIRRLLEGALRTLPLMAAAFAPLLLALALGWAHGVWPWSDPQAVAHDELLAHKQPYLNVPFFSARAVFYFAVWIGFASALLRLSNRLDRSGDPRLLRRMRAFSGPGLALYGLTMTFAAVDWGMSLEPHQFSTIYGARFVVGQALSTLALAIVLAGVLRRRAPFERWLGAGHFHDLGKLLFAFIMLWAYLAFSEFLIIWSGNLAEETPFYLRRMHGVWGFTAAALIALHFFLPFGLLLSRQLKRNPETLSKVAWWILAMRLVDFYWLLVPGFEQRSWLVYVQVPLLCVALGGLWLAALVRGLRGRPLMSLHDAHLEATLEHAPSAQR